MSNKRESAGAIWRKQITTKAGQEMEVLSITIGDKRFTAFINSYKTDDANDRSPDYKIYEDTYTPKEGSVPAAKPAPAKKSFAGQNDDLPF